MDSGTAGRDGGGIGGGMVGCRHRLMVIWNMGMWEGMGWDRSLTSILTD